MSTKDKGKTYKAVRLNNNDNTCIVPSVKASEVLMAIRTKVSILNCKLHKLWLKREKHIAVLTVILQ